MIRPFPVGLSVVKIESVKGRQIYISGLDLIDGTPLLDIKPYHPLDIIQNSQLKIPAWIPDIEGNNCKALNDVVIPESIQQELQQQFDESGELIKSKWGGFGCFIFFESVPAFLNVSIYPTQRDRLSNVRLGNDRSDTLLSEILQRFDF